MIEIQFHFTPIFRQGDIKFLQHYCFIDPTLYCTHMAIMGIYSTVFLTLAIHNVTLTLVSLDIDPAFLFWTCTWNIQWRWFLYLYIYCVVCYRVIVAPYVRSVGHVFAYLYTLDDDSECYMDYETSLLPKVFPSVIMFKM